MARKRKNLDTKNEAQFLDMTRKNWYNKEGTDTVTFCDSLNDIIEGNSETFVFTDMIISEGKYASKEGTEVVKSFFCIFLLADGNFILCRKRDKIK